MKTFQVVSLVFFAVITVLTVVAVIIISIVLSQPRTTPAFIPPTQNINDTPSTQNHTPSTQPQVTEPQMNGLSIRHSKVSPDHKNFRIFIVTYKKDNIQNLLRALINSDLKSFTYEIIVINNYGLLNIDEDLREEVIVWDQYARPDFSTGHLARDWNSAIVNGFQSLVHPKSDIVVAIQADETVAPTWATYIWKMMTVDHISYAQFPNGDAFQAWTVDGVKAIGLFDERFANIACQEEDYFTRAMMWNRDRTSLNEVFQRIGFERHQTKNVLLPWNKGDDDAAHKASKKYHPIAYRVWDEKWPNFKPFQKWDPNAPRSFWPQKPAIPTFMFYPYFEADIPNLEEKNYIFVKTVMDFNSSILPKVNILIPMAGAGSRFAKVGYKDIKPLIKIRNKPMIEWVIDNVKIPNSNFIFVVQKTHADEYDLATYLQKICPNSKVVLTDGLTEGAACTALLAKEHIDSEVPLMTVNSDQFLEWSSSSFVENIMSDPKCDGGISTFILKDGDPKWSYVKKDNGDYISELQEKKVISDIATTGVYFWKKGSSFVRYAEEMIKKNIRVNNEFYIGPVYNQGIADGQKYRIQHCNKMWGLGVPEDLEYFLDHFSFNKL